MEFSLISSYPLEDVGFFARLPKGRGARFFRRAFAGFPEAALRCHRSASRRTSERVANFCLPSRWQLAAGGRICPLRIVVTTLSLLSAYTLLLSILPQFMVALTVNFAISPFIIVMFAAVMGPVILCSGFPRSFFGPQTSNWKSALSIFGSRLARLHRGGGRPEADPHPQPRPLPVFRSSASPTCAKICIRS